MWIGHFMQALDSLKLLTHARLFVLVSNLYKGAIVSVILYCSSTSQGLVLETQAPALGLKPVAGTLPQERMLRHLQ